MEYDGHDYRPNKHLGYRMSRFGDVYGEGAITHEAGTKIPSHHVVIFRKKHMPDGGPTQVRKEMLVPICAHIGSRWHAIGVPVVKKSTRSSKAKYNTGAGMGERIPTGQRYVEQAHYLVNQDNDEVYQWTSRRATNAEDTA